MPPSDTDAHQVYAIDNRDDADLTDAHQRVLTQFDVKAELVAPLFHQNQPWGLLCAHQCAKPRSWQQAEVQLWTQIASLVGLALDKTQLQSQVNRRVEQGQLCTAITHQLRTSLNAEDILNTTVAAVRRTLNCDRVVVYSLDANGYGTVVAAATRPDIATTQLATLEDTCFTHQGLVDQYESGHVHRH